MITYRSGSGGCLGTAGWVMTGRRIGLFAHFKDVNLKPEYRVNRNQTSPTNMSGIVSLRAVVECVNQMC